MLVWDVFPKDAEMCQIAAELGYSETVFARPEQGGFRVRYFSPESEIPFCGYALALGAALCEHYGDGQFELTLNDAKISVCENRPQMAFAPHLNLRQRTIA